MSQASFPWQMLLTLVPDPLRWSVGDPHADSSKTSAFLVSPWRNSARSTHTRHPPTCRSISARAISGFVRAVRYSAGTPARSNRAPFARPTLGKKQPQCQHDWYFASRKRQRYQGLAVWRSCLAPKHIAQRRRCVQALLSIQRSANHGRPLQKLTGKPGVFNTNPGSNRRTSSGCGAGQIRRGVSTGCLPLPRLLRRKAPTLITSSRCPPFGSLSRQTLHLSSGKNCSNKGTSSLNFLTSPRDACAPPGCSR
jgi:hypothetical protein